MGALSLLGGLIGLVSDAASALGSLISGAVYAAIGVWTRRAAASFGEIVSTEGSDVNHLMGALGELLKLYKLQYWLVMAMLVILGLGLLAGIFAGLTG